MNILSSALFLQVPEWVLEYWHPSEKAMYPDYFSKREQWKKLRLQSWDKEVSLVHRKGIVSNSSFHQVTLELN